MILAYREFFDKDEKDENKPESYKSLGIYCCSFSDIRAVKEEKGALLEKFGSRGFVRLKIVNR